MQGDLHTPRLVHYGLLGSRGSMLQHPSLHLKILDMAITLGGRSDALRDERDSGMWVPIREVVQIALD